jgi:hypothetical protein
MFVRFLWKPAAATVILLRCAFFNFLHAIWIIADSDFPRGNKVEIRFRFVSASLPKMGCSGN